MGMLDRTPLGCRLVFGLCIAIHCLSAWSHHTYQTLNLPCRPVDVVFGLQLQRLVLASFVHTSFPGLCLALLISWRRFAYLEANYGTFGFLLWFFWLSLVLHGAYCFVAICIGPLFDSSAGSGEVKGLFPLLVASLVAGSRESGDTEVWLWPLPFHVSLRALPLVVMGSTWLFHLQAHYDVVVAYLLAQFVPSLVELDVARLSEAVEQTALGRCALGWLQGFDAYQCRPPYLGGQDIAGACRSPGRNWEPAEAWEEAPAPRGGTAPIATPAAPARSPAPQPAMAPVVEAIPIDDDLL